MKTTVGGVDVLPEPANVVSLQPTKGVQRQGECVREEGGREGGKQK